MVLFITKFYILESIFFIMFNETTLKQLIASIFILIILVFSYFLIKPIFLSLIFGLILAYSFYPVNNLLQKKIKNPTLTSGITCSAVLVILLGAIWFFLPMLTSQIFNIYITLQSWDFGSFLEENLSFLLTTPQSKANYVAAYNTFVSTLTNTTLQSFSNLISNFGALVLKSIVVIIAMFYGLRDGEKIIEIMKSSLPFSRNITTRFVEKSKQVTYSVVFGRIIIGILTGLLAGIGFFIAGVPNALLLTFIAIIVSIIPIIGPWAVWIPVVGGLLITGNTIAGFFLLVYCGIFVTLFENLSHPIFVSKKSKIPTSLTLFGIIGGMLAFGIFGLILGPLIVAYLLVLFEIYIEYNTKKTAS